MNRAEIANLLRAAADEELSGAERARLETHLAANPADRAFIDFERRLREAVARVMGAERSPDSLRGEIESHLSGDGEVLPFALASRAQAQRRWRVRPSGLAAGFVLLIGAAVVVSVINPSLLSDWRRASTINVDAEVGLGFADEHRRCATDEQYAREKLDLHSREELLAHLERDLGWEIEAPDLSEFGFVLRSAGDCAIGGAAAGIGSVHLLFDDGAVAVSVWIEHSLPSELTHSARLEEGRAYRIAPIDRRRGRDEANAYFAWRVGEYVFRFVPASVENAREMAVAIGMPDVEPTEFK